MASRSNPVSPSNTTSVFKVFDPNSQKNKSPDIKLKQINSKNRPDNPSLVLIFCIHRTQEISTNEDIVYRLDIFEHLIKAIQELYPSRKLNIIVADTLDNHNREEKDSAVQDGSEWVNQHEPILVAMGLKKGTNYGIKKWSEYAKQAEEAGYFAEFKHVVNDNSWSSKKSNSGKLLEIRELVDKIARQFHKKQTPNFDELSSDEQQALVKRSFEYSAEDYGVTFYIASILPNALFFQQTPNGDRMKLIRWLNLSPLAEKGQAFFQSYYDASVPSSKSNDQLSSVTTDGVISSSGFFGLPSSSVMDSSSSISDKQISNRDQQVKSSLLSVLQRYDELDPHTKDMVTLNVAMLRMLVEPRPQDTRVEPQR